jgi:hypothetical protein
VAILSGLTDMDDYALDGAVVTSAWLDVDHGWRVIVLASLANSGVQVDCRDGTWATPIAFPHRNVVRPGVAGRDVDSVALASGMKPTCDPMSRCFVVSIAFVMALFPATKLLSCTIEATGCDDACCHPVCSVTLLTYR